MKIENRHHYVPLHPHRLRSAQVQALMGNLLRLRADDSSVKSLVVSQFTRFLSILEAPLR